MNGSPFTIPSAWIYDNIIIHGYANPQIYLGLYNTLFKNIFKTIATVVIDAEGKLNISIAAEDPDVNWQGYVQHYPYLKTMVFRTMVILPGSTLLS